MMPYNLRKRPTPPVEEPQKQKKPKVKTTTKAEPSTKVKATTKAEPSTKVKATTKAEPSTKAKTTTKAQPSTKAKTTTVAEPSTKAETNTKAEPSTKAETNTKPETTAKPEAITKAETTTDKSGSQLLLGFGVDSCGELGLGRIGLSRKNPTKVPIEDSIKQVACGPMHTIALTDDGQALTFGCNDEGALGRVTDGDEDLESTPTIIPIDHKVIKISAGDSHSAILTDKAEVFVFGNFRDEHGSVGLTPECDGKASYKPIQILEDLKLKDIASGSNHMLVLDVDGNVYSFGVGAQGQLGRIKMDDVGENGNESKAITAENREIFLTPQLVSLKDVDPQRPFICDAIYAGNFSSFATNTDKKKNRLAAWGLNNYYQLGFKGQKGQLVQPLPKRSTFTCSTVMIDVACGQHHTLFLTKSGRVSAAGRHEYGMLGLGKLDKEVCPAKRIDCLTNIINISAGINTSFAVDNQGKLFSWGMGGINLGLQSEEDITAPSEVTCLKDKKVVSVAAGGSFTTVVAQ